jgi:DNA-binding transcriptional MerR regulator
MPDEDRYSLAELADLAGVTPRTVRYYLAQGLLPAVGQTGPGSKYDEDHLARLRLIRRLQVEHLPLAEIRRRLDDLEANEIRELAGDPEPPAPPDSALDYLRSVLAGPPSGRPRMARLAAPMAGSERSIVDDRSMAARMTSTSPPGPTTAARVERSLWERVVLSPDVELHLRRPLTRAQNKQVDRLVTIARELLEEDRP